MASDRIGNPSTQADGDLDGLPPMTAKPKTATQPTAPIEPQDMVDATCIWLEAQFKLDPNAGLADHVISRISGVYATDRHGYQRIRSILKAHSCLREAERAIKRAAHLAAKNVIEMPGADDGPQSVRSVLQDAPVDAEAVIPSGWVLRHPRAGKAALLRVEMVKSEGIEVPVTVPVCADPMVLTSWITNTTTGEKCVEVAWKGGGKWRRQVVEKKAFSDPRKVASILGSHGALVTAVNAMDIVRYLSDYEAQNKQQMSTRDVAEQMGWQKDGSFLVGRRCIGGDVEFLSASPGNESLADAVTPVGDFAVWKAQMAKVALAYPRVEFGVYASLATPLLKILGAHNFIVDYAYTTSSGKTSALRVAASVWGNPDERSPSSFIQTWDATQVGIECVGTTLAHLPLFLDDTKRAQRFRGQSIIPAIVYSIAQGRGRVRGDRNGGPRETSNWRTIMFTSGENKVLDESKDGGTAGRVISLWGSPFGGADAEIARDVDEINCCVRHNFGHAGPDFIEQLMLNEIRWPEFRRRYAEICMEFSRGRSSIARRLSDYLATVQLAAELAHEFLDLGWTLISPVRQLFGEISDEAEIDSDRPKQALAYAYEWATANRRRFWRPAMDRSDISPQSWLGRWDEDLVSARWEWLGFLRGELCEALRRAGYAQPDAMIRAWNERGWLVKDGNGDKATFRQRIDGDLVRLVAVSRSAVDEVCLVPPGGLGGTVVEQTVEQKRSIDI